MAQIDSPLLNCLEITLSYQLIFDTPQLIQFISRAPKLEVHDRTRFDFSDSNVRLTFSKTSSSRYNLSLMILCNRPEWQLSSMAQICTSFFPRSFIRTVERLSIRERRYSTLEWKDDIEYDKWLELLHPFTGVKDLHLSREFAALIVPSLQEFVGGRTTEVLPALQTLLLEELHPPGAVGEAIRKFIASRQLSNYLVAVPQ